MSGASEASPSADAADTEGDVAGTFWASPLMQDAFARVSTARGDPGGGRSGTAGAMRAGTGPAASPGSLAPDLDAADPIVRHDEIRTARPARAAQGGAGAARLAVRPAGKADAPLAPCACPRAERLGTWHSTGSSRWRGDDRAALRGTPKRVNADTNARCIAPRTPSACARRDSHLTSVTYRRQPYEPPRLSRSPRSLDRRAETVVHQAAKKDREKVRQSAFPGSRLRKRGGLIGSPRAIGRTGDGGNPPLTGLPASSGL